MGKRKVFMYAFNELHGLEMYRFLEGNDITIQNMKRIAQWMMDARHGIRRIYAMDNRYGLYDEYWKAVNTPDFVTHFEFEETVSHEGILILEQ